MIRVDSETGLPIFPEQRAKPPAPGLLYGVAVGVATADAWVHLGLHGLSQGWTIARAVIEVVHPTLSGGAAGQAHASGYLFVWADWTCIVLAPGLPVHERDEMQTQTLAMCDYHRFLPLYRSQLREIRPITPQMPPQPCCIHDPQFIPFTPDRP